MITKKAISISLFILLSIPCFNLRAAAAADTSMCRLASPQELLTRLQCIDLDELQSDNHLADLYWGSDAMTVDAKFTLYRNHKEVILSCPSSRGQAELLVFLDAVWHIAMDRHTNPDRDPSSSEHLNRLQESRNRQASRSLDRPVGYATSSSAAISGPRAQSSTRLLPSSQHKPKVPPRGRRVLWEQNGSQSLNRIIHDAGQRERDVTTIDDLLNTPVLDCRKPQHGDITPAQSQLHSKHQADSGGDAEDADSMDAQLALLHAQSQAATEYWCDGDRRSVARGILGTTMPQEEEEEEEEEEKQAQDKTKPGDTRRSNTYNNGPLLLPPDPSYNKTSMRRILSTLVRSPFTYAGGAIAMHMGSRWNRLPNTTRERLGHFRNLFGLIAVVKTYSTLKKAIYALPRVQRSGQTQSTGVRYLTLNQKPLTRKR